MRYSLTRFGLGSGESVISLTMNCTASFNGSFGVGANVVLKDVSMAAVFDSKTQGSIGLPLVMDLSADLILKSFGGISLEFLFRASADFSAEAQLSANFPIQMDLSEFLLGEFILGANLPLRAEFVSKFDTNAVLGADFAFEANFAEILSAGVSAVDIFEEISLISLNLSPNDELRIDSENYSVTLNGVNILHLQEGDWIRLNRELLALNIDCGTVGTLGGSLVYEERWL